MSAAPAPASQLLALSGHATGDAIVAWRGGEPIRAVQLAADVARTADALPDARHILNFCADRYRFTVVLLAAILREQVTLLPPTTTAHVLRSMREFAADVFFVADDEAMHFPDLPRAPLPDVLGSAPGGASLPPVPSERLVACVFTSGSTGEPQPHRKSWGGLVQGARAEAARFGVGARHAILGTVPSQHMYGLESTILLPLVGGAALTAERPFYPADVDSSLERLPAPRMLFTTPFHLKAWLESGNVAGLETIVSATAPLSAALAAAAEQRTGAELHEIYGCTEAGQVATRRPTLDLAWRPFDGLRVTSDGERAWVSGGHVEWPTPLQDVIELVGDGERFLLHGRSTDMVNIAGKRNSLAYLNHQLHSVPGVKDGVFHLPAETPDGVTRLMAFVVAPGMKASQVLAALRERIDAAFLPRPLLLVDSLPRQQTGKLPRTALDALARQARDVADA